MQRTNLVVVFCCLVAVMMGSLAGAHLTNPSGSASSFALTGDPYRYAGPTASSNLGVSGTYVGAAGTFVHGDAFPVRLSPLDPLFPTGYSDQAFSYCDAEVSGQGDGGPTDALDETTVDNGPGGILVPDGSWDDGGQGGACHLDLYATASYATLGCTGTAHARDAVLGGAVWIAAACDDTTPVHVDPAVVQCYEEAALHADVGRVATCAQWQADDLTCSLRETCPAGLFMSCGADGILDAFNFGSGDSVSPGQGVAYPADIYGCETYGLATVFVLDAVEANTGSLSSVTAATAGWIDWSARSTGTQFSAPGPGTDVCATPAGPVLQLLPPPVGPFC